MRGSQLIGLSLVARHRKAMAFDVSEGTSGCHLSCHDGSSLRPIRGSRFWVGVWVLPMFRLYPLERTSGGGEVRFGSAADIRARIVDFR
jgi:hypothetical protein